IVIAAGETTGTLFVETADPDVYIDPSSITATVSGVTGGNFEAVDFSEATATAQISDTIDTTTMNLSGPEYVAEGESATYTVSVDNAPQTDMTVDVTYSYISASTNDVVTNTTQVVLEAGQTSAQFAVDAVDDMIHEGIETFNVSISNPQGGNFENLVLENANVATNIADSDAPPFFSINDVTVDEGDGTITFTVTKAGATALASSVDYTVNPNTAGTPGDYAAGTSALSGTLNFAAGVTTQTITLNITDDYVYEPTETFYVNLSNPVAANISDAQGIGTILDDDSKPAFSINDMTVNEGDGTITFTVTKAGATALASSV
ncbi:MAG: Calx-beta domain-containing protein, partial [Desulfobacterales bacterium]|nr:Calx-beta domain-containing protein [Desulfobacterales bacterium]